MPEHYKKGARSGLRRESSRGRVPPSSYQLRGIPAVLRQNYPLRTEAIDELRLSLFSEAAQHQSDGQDAPEEHPSKSGQTTMSA